MWGEHRMAVSEINTLGGYFLHWVDEDPTRLFLETRDEKVTYGEAMTRVAGMIQSMEELRIDKGEAIACYLEEQVPMLYMMLASALSGRLPTPCSPVFSVKYLKEGIIDRVGAAGVFATADTAPALVEAGISPLVIRGKGLPDGVKVIDPDKPLGFDEARALLERASSNVHAEDLLLIATTSGSTGQPKLVLRRHLAPARYAKFVGDQLIPEDERPHRFLMIAALTHAFGLHMLTTALRHGAALLVPSDIDVGARIGDIRELQPTVLPMVPRVLKSIYSQYLEEGDQHPRIFGDQAQYVVTAGGVADPEILANMRKQGLQIIACYGSTEASVVSVTPRDAWRPHYSGVVVPDVDLQIGPEGELRVYSPGVTPGYYADDALTKEAFTVDGYYKTGDFGEVAADGYLRILGRKKDVLNTQEGSNIYPERIELMLERFSWARQVILLGDQRPYVIAFVSVSDDWLLTDETAEDYFFDGSTDIEAVLTDGYCPVDKYPELYQRIGNDIGSVNDELERVEKIVRFALYSRSFEAEVYSATGTGKVKRNRRVLEQLYKERVEKLYASQPVDASFVPGVDRRLRRR